MITQDVLKFTPKHGVRMKFMTLNFDILTATNDWKKKNAIEFHKRKKVPTVLK